MEIKKNEQNELMKEIASENFKRWNEQLQTKKPELVAEMYDEKGELFGTVSSKIRKGRKEIAEYFKHFLESNPEGKVTKREIKKIDENTYWEEGDYTFTVDSEDGGRKEIEARFTYLWQKNQKDEWKIIHHHSSAKNKENDEIFKEEKVIDLSKGDIEEGLTKKLTDNFTLKTGFFQTTDRKIVRFSWLTEKEKEKEKIVNKHLSLRPDESSGV